ncbi:MAG TPA: FAD-dependent oxidoreductase [Solirubrobacteraceae bacterium]|jgi:succinate dehydrogenase/fumarate reductase flavoprotein subunit
MSSENASPVLEASGEESSDHEADVVVVGTGIAGCSVAVNGVDLGASVVVVEKSLAGGGTSAKAAGGMMIPNNRHMQAAGQEDPREDFLRFLARVGRPLLYRPDAELFGLPEWEYRLIETYYDNAAEAIGHLEDLGAIRAAHQPEWASYNDLPEDKGRFGRVIFNVDENGELTNGRAAIDRLLEFAQRSGAILLREHRVDGVYVNAAGELVGVRARADGREVRLRAHKAVVFATGGFPHSARYAREYLNGMYVGGCAARTSEGDIIPIAKALGLPLFHMHSAWGAPLLYEQALDEDPGLIANFSLTGDSVLSVNKYGRRACNEKTTYNDRTQSHFAWDPSRAEYPNFLQFAILDERARRLFAKGDGIMDHQGGNLIPPLGAESKYVLRADTLEGLSELLQERLRTLAKASGGVKLAPEFLANLKETIARFNGFARSGVDEDFHRGESAIELFMHGERADDNDLPNPTLHPLASEGPYYAAILAPGAIDTKGGPKVNERLQILDGNDAPVPGLYGVGNCVASPAGQAYWSGGSTWGPYVTFGYVAARAIVAEAPKGLAPAAAVGAS